MKNFLRFLSLMLWTSFLSSYAGAQSVFISEYIEGTSNNKAIEIYNGTESVVDLAAEGYVLQFYFNGSVNAGLNINLSGTVSPGDVYVVAHASADAAILAQADQTNGAGWFNGDDAVVLRVGGSNGQMLDVIGQVGFDPGTEWGSGSVSTADNTIRRKSSSCEGDSNPNDTFNPNAAWEGFTTNTFDGLGTHTTSCGMLQSPALVINEIDADTPGTDTQEFIELYDGGAGSTSLDGFVVVLYNGNGDVAYDAIDLDGYTTNAEGLFVIGSGTVPHVDLEVFASNGLQNGADAIALYQGSAADFPDGTAITTENLVDAIVYGTNDADDAGLLVLLNNGQPQVNENENESLQRIPNGNGGTRNTSSFSALPPTPGEENMVDEGPVEPALTLIHDIQGSEAVSPMAGQTVMIRGIVVGDFQEDDGDIFNTDLDGFYVQEEAEDFDSHEATSEGIFVYTSNASVTVPDVKVGDTVAVIGNVVEFNGLTELVNISAITVKEGNTIPAPIVVNLPATDAELERYEGMLVIFPQPLVISEYFDYDRYGEIVLSYPLDDLDRPFQPTAYVQPGPEAAQIQDAIEVRRITLDDGRSIQNPDPARHPNGEVFTLENRFRGGDVVQHVVGVLDYRFNLFRIQPTQAAEYIQTNPRSETPEAVGGSLKIASFNVLNYFTTLGSRGADSPEEFERQRNKIIAALAAIHADIVGLIEIQNNTEAIINLVNGLNERVGEGTYDYINTGVIGTDEIKVAFIYKPAKVSPVGEYAVLTSAVDPRFIDTRNRPALAQTFEEKATGGVLTVVVNHFKSKGSGCGAGDDDPQQGNCNLTRTQAAEALVDWLATDPTHSGDPDFMIIGDLNAYDEEDPIDEVKAGADDALGTEDDYIDLVEQFNGEFAYSYVFDGQLGYLDYALASKSLAAQITGATEWHINSDEPDILDYQLNLDSDAQPERNPDLYAADPFRASDHDPIIVGLDLLPPVCASEPTLPVLKKNGKKSQPKILLDQGHRNFDGIVQHVKLRGFEDQHKLVVVSKQPITSAPEDGIRYEASTEMGEGDAMEEGVFVVQNNNLHNSDFTLTGLEAETTYYVAVFIYTTGEQCGPNYLPEIVTAEIFKTKRDTRDEIENVRDKLQSGLLSAFPNPVHDIFCINVPSEKAQQIEILLSDVWGATVSLGNFPIQSGDNILEFDIQDLQLSKKWYLLKVKSQNQVYPVIRLWVN